MKIFLFFLSCLVSLSAADFTLPKKHKQAIVGITEGWNSSFVKLTIYEKQKDKWTAIGPSWKARIGRQGCAWGLGLSPQLSKNVKKEGDGRAPAGVFKIGAAYGYAKSIVKHSKQPYITITSRHMWVEDSKSDKYNQHYVLDHEPRTAWEKKQQMRQNDFAHSLKLYIGHNTATKRKAAIPGQGSAIFFHIWRKGGAKPTSGCTAMHPKSLKKLISTIDPSKHPVYILLPRTEYIKLKDLWKLP